MKYPFKYKPYDFQQVVLDTLETKKKYALFSEMGTGKSKMILDSICIKYLKGEIDSLVVIAPKGVYGNWVNGEIPKHCFVDYTIWANKGSKLTKTSLGNEQQGLKIFVLNTEMFSYSGISQVFNKMRSLIGPKRAIVLDESTFIKNGKSKRTKELIKFSSKFESRYILSGFCVLNSPVDLFSQFKFLDDSITGHKSEFTFKNYYCNQVTQFMGQRSFKKIVGYRNIDILSAKIKPHCTFIKKKDCLDLPDKVYLTRRFEMSAEQKKAYKEMKQMLLLKRDEISTYAEVQHAIVQLIKLQQITCGFIMYDEHKEGESKVKKIECFPGVNSRLESLIEVIEECSSKVIIWTGQVYSIELIVERLQKDYGKESVVSYYGKSTPEEMKHALESFEDPDSPVRFFVSNPSKGGAGITLLQGTTVVYYTNSFNLEHRVQSEDRSHRIGQTNKVTYIDLIAEESLDDRILKVLKNKKSLEEIIREGKIADFLK